MQMKQCACNFFVCLKLLLELHHCNEHLVVGLQPWVCIREFEVEHQWKGTDGSLISKLETKMINTSEHSGFPWDCSETNSSVLYIHARVFVSAHVWVSLYIMETFVHLCCQRRVCFCVGRWCLLLYLHQIKVQKEACIPLYVNRTKLLDHVEVCLTCVGIPVASAKQAGRVADREGEAEQPSTRKSLKHTTDIKDS